MGASRTMLLGCLAEPALLLVLFVLALLAGSLNLDPIAAMQIGERHSLADRRRHRARRDAAGGAG